MHLHPNDAAGNGLLAVGFAGPALLAVNGLIEANPVPTILGVVGAIVGPALITLIREIAACVRAQISAAAAAHTAALVAAADARTAVLVAENVRLAGLLTQRIDDRRPAPTESAACPPPPPIPTGPTPPIPTSPPTSP